MIKWYETIDSTNTQALKEAEHSEEGTVWAADYQTAGRGQRGNSWESARGKNLTFTLLFKPIFLSPVDQFKISQIVTLGIVNYLRTKDIDAKIKWPNDIYVNHKKICGILIEHTLSGDILSASIAGIGFNLNQTRFESGALNPTSLLLLSQSNEEYDRKGELIILLDSIFKYYESLCNWKIEDIQNEYLSLLYRNDGSFYKYKEIGENANLSLPVEKIEEGDIIEAKIVGVNPNGCLVLENKSGSLKEYAFKELQYIL